MVSIKSGLPLIIVSFKILLVVSLCFVYSSTNVPIPVTSHGHSLINFFQRL